MENFLIEGNVSANDNIVQKMGKGLNSYMKKKLKRGDKDLIELMHSMGYFNTDKDTIMSKREDLINNFTLSQDFTDEILDVSNLLSKYMSNGSFNKEKCKLENPNNFDEIMRIKNFIDIIGVTRLYDETANAPSTKFGVKWNSKDFEKEKQNFNFNSITDSEANKFRKDKLWTTEEARWYKQLGYLNKYLDFKYGIGTDIPNIKFSKGNNKLPNNTLIINFTSALNCPAWNECIIKHACYARAVEKGKPATFRGNENRSLYWLTAQNDPYLLQLMMNFIRSYCFNYVKVAEYIIKNGIAIQKKFNDTNKLAEFISKKQLDDPFFTSEIIEIMKNNKRVENIRLNENGDFIGQWLVDAWELEASKYSLYNINVSAYTCKLLNYNNIKHIILNTSYVNNSTGNIARHFIAVPDSIYDSLDETYGGNNNELTLQKDNKIITNPQLLYDVKTKKPNGKTYYKCPCGREIGDKKINCYQCNLCYLPNNTNSNMYVFVKAHGSNSKQLNGYDLIKHGIGVSEHFLQRYKGGVVQEGIDYNKSNLQLAQHAAIDKVTNNAIYSVNNHFQELRNNINESLVPKGPNDVLDIMKRINNIK